MAKKIIVLEIEVKDGWQASKVGQKIHDQNPEVRYVYVHDEPNDQCSSGARVGPIFDGFGRGQQLLRCQTFGERQDRSPLPI